MGAPPPDDCEEPPRLPFDPQRTYGGTGVRVQRLTEEQREWIVRRLAEFARGTTVRAELAERWQVQISVQGVLRYATSAAWRERFEAYRAAYLARPPRLSYPTARLDILDDLLDDLLARRPRPAPLILQLLREAREEQVHIDRALGRSSTSTVVDDQAAASHVDAQILGGSPGEIDEVLRSKLGSLYAPDADV